MDSICELCGSKDDELNFHHLIPISQHSRNPVKRLHDRKYMKTNCIDICKFYCHIQIHKLVSEKDMSLKYYTKELLILNDSIDKYIKWRKKQIKI